MYVSFQKFQEREIFPFLNNSIKKKKSFWTAVQCTKCNEMKKIESFTQLKRNCEWPKPREIEKILAKSSSVCAREHWIVGRRERRKAAHSEGEKVNLLRFTFFVSCCVHELTLACLITRLYSISFTSRDKKFILSLAYLVYVGPMLLLLSLLRREIISHDVSLALSSLLRRCEEWGERETFKRYEIARDYSHFLLRQCAESS